MEVRLPRRTLILAALAAGILGLVVAAVLVAVGRMDDTVATVGAGMAVVGFVSAMVLGREGLVRAARGRQARYASNAVLGTSALLGILVLANVVVYRNPKSWDLTEDRQYSLAPETVDALHALSSDVRLIGFYSLERAAARDQLRPLLQRYQEASDGRVTFEFVDPRAEPFRAQEFGVTRDGSLVVAMGGASEVTTFASEQEITGAIIRLSNPGERAVYLLTGHGERDAEATDELGYSQLRQALEAKNYTIETLSLLVSPQVPEDARAVVVAGPTEPLSEAEIGALTAYLENGGGLVVLADPLPGMSPAAPDPLVEYLAREWGVTLRQDVVFDLSSSLPYAAISASYASHPITERLRNLATYFPTARSLAVAESDDSRTRTELILTGADSWGETTLEGLTEDSVIEFDEVEDAPGPLVIGATVEDFAAGARIVVIGDSDFAANADFFGLGNGDLLVNSVDWAAGEDDLISLTPKQTTDRFVSPPTRGMALLVVLVAILLLPGAFIVLGISTWLRRRARA